MSPLKSDLENTGTVEWIPLKPSTDVALILAICFEINKAGVTNKDFVKKYTVGFQRFTEYLCGKEDGVTKNADWASQITGVSKEIIL